MNYSIEGIKNAVRKLIDENEDNTPLITETEEVASDTDAITEALILQSVDAVHQIAPLSMLSDAETVAMISLSTYKKGKAGPVPPDFLRLVYVDCEDWSRKLFEGMDPTSGQYEMQASEFAGVRGSATRPVMALIPGSTGLVLEVYTTTKDTAELVYVKKAETVEGNVVIARQLYDAVLNMVARYYKISIGETEASAGYAKVVEDLTGVSSQPQAEG